MANNISIDQIFKCFLDTKVEDVIWPQETHAYVRNNGENLKYFNNTDKHAEKRIVEEYLEHEPRNSEIIKNVKIVINYSPCVDCSECIDTFLSRRPDIKLEIVFAGLYFIKRKVPCPSGILQPFKIREGRIYDSTENSNGLKKLRDKQVVLRTFCPEDWRNLWSTLDELSKDNRQTMRNIVSEDTIRTRLREDACVKVELEIMLGDSESDNHLQEVLGFIKQGTFESDNHVQELMGFFNQVPRPAVPRPAEPPQAEPPQAGAGAGAGAEVGLEERLGGMKLDKDARDT